MKFLITVILVVALMSTGFAGDWVFLHNKADTIILETARSEADSAPGSVDALYALGLVYLNLYKAPEARQAFEKALEIDPQSVGASWGLAEVLRREHRLNESAQRLKAVLKEAPDFSPALISLAYIEYIQGRFDASIRLTGRVINQGRDSVDASNFLRAHGLYAAAKGMIAHYGGPVSKAINGAGVLKHLDIIQKLAPGSPVVNFGLGSYYLLIPVAFGRNLDKAKGYLEKTISADPLFPDPYVRLAQIYQLEGDQAKYQEYLAKALSLDPGNELALDIQSGKCLFICFDKGGNDE